MAIVKGDAWVLQSDDAGYVFVTAAHLFNGVSLSRFNLENEPLVYLGKKGLPCLRLSSRNVFLMEGYDLAFIKTPKLSDKDLPPLPVGKIYHNSHLLNVGYPFRAIVGQSIILNTTNKAFSFNGGPWAQEGGFAGNLTLSIQSEDIKLNHRKVIFLDYTSEPGFSGGPLLNKETNAVVGIMLGVLPSAQYNPGVPSDSFAFALYVEEIISALESLPSDIPGSSR
ncbi:MAG: trypsin-like peptidase domain-containing protein [Candidatus Omnitrophica bacterium]|nr:trypsin-like peptidase domain-containing protein [Candidatus Omnitrophota bacterium]